MKTAIVYTVLSIVNLIAFAVGLTFLPAEVAIHFDFKGVVDGIGSPWVYVSIPAVSAVVSAGVWAALHSKNEKNAKISVGLLAALGAVFAVLGWTFFALAAQGLALGEKSKFPFALVTILPLSLLFVFFGNYLPRIKPNRWVGIRTPATLGSETVWAKTHRVGGTVMFVSGILSAICAVVFSCVPGNLAYVSLIVFGAVVVGFGLFAFIYAHVLYRKEAALAAQENS